MNVTALALAPPQSSLPTHIHNRRACTCEYKHPLSTHAPTPTKTHTCSLCMEANVVHACLVELSYVEKIFDLSQAAYQLLHYLHSVSWVCCLLGPSPASDAGYRGSQRGYSHTFLFERMCVCCARGILCLCCSRRRI